VGISRSAVCALACVAIVLSACSAGNGPSPSHSTSSQAPSSVASTNARPIAIDHNCNENEPCTFDAGSYVLSDANAPDGTLLPGLGFTLDSTWTSTEIWLGSVELHPAAFPGTVAILVDTLPASPEGGVAGDAENNASAIVASLAANPSLITTDVTQTTIGNGIAATAVTIGISPSWVTLDPDCPVETCSNLFIRPDWWCCTAIGIGERVRVYVADIGSDPASPHTLMIVLGTKEDAPTLSDAQFADLETRVRPFLDSLVIPDELIIYCGDTHPARRC